MVVTEKKRLGSQVGEISRGVEHPHETAKAGRKGVPEGERTLEKQGDDKSLSIHVSGSTKVTSIENAITGWHATFLDDGMIKIVMRDGENATVDPKKLPFGDKAVVHSTLPGTHDGEFVAIAKIAVKEQTRIREKVTGLWGKQE